MSSGTKATNKRKGKPEAGQAKENNAPERSAKSILRNIFCIIAGQISQILKILKHIPNLITLSNLFCGLLAILYAFGGHLNIAAGFILLGAFFDFFDGLTARLLKVSGELGKQLDSLADLITFGVAPGILVFQLLFLLETDAFFNPFEAWESRAAYSLTCLPYIALLIPLFSALRLAKFNIDTRQTDSFIGLPTPANALFFMAIPLMMRFQPDHFLVEYITNTKILTGIIILLCLFMVSEIPLLALKFKNLTWADNKMRFVLIALSVLLLWQFRFVAVPIIILLYPILSIINKRTQ